MSIILKESKEESYVWKKAENYVNEEYDFSYYPEDNLSTRANAEHDWRTGGEFGYYQANDWHNQNMDDIYDSISKDWSLKYFICIMKDKSRVIATMMRNIIQMI